MPVAYELQTVEKLDCPLIELFHLVQGRLSLVYPKLYFKKQICSALLDLWTELEVISCLADGHHEVSMHRCHLTSLLQMLCAQLEQSLNTCNWCVEEVDCLPGPLESVAFPICTRMHVGSESRSRQKKSSIPGSNVRVDYPTVFHWSHSLPSRLSKHERLSAVVFISIHTIVW